jgi:hypothetical protein
MAVIVAGSICSVHLCNIISGTSYVLDQVNISKISRKLSSFLIRYAAQHFFLFWYCWIFQQCTYIFKSVCSTYCYYAWIGLPSGNNAGSAKTALDPNRFKKYPEPIIFVYSEISFGTLCIFIPLPPIRAYITILWLTKFAMGRGGGRLEPGTSALQSGALLLSQLTEAHFFLTVLSAGSLSLCLKIPEAKQKFARFSQFSAVGQIPCF